MAKDHELPELPSTLTYAVDTITVKKDQTLEVGPSDLVFFSSVAPANNYTFVVLRRTDGP